VAGYQSSVLTLHWQTDCLLASSTSGETARRILAVEGLGFITNYTIAWQTPIRHSVRRGSRVLLDPLRYFKLRARPQSGPSRISSREEIEEDISSWHIPQHMSGGEPNSSGHCPKSSSGPSSFSSPPVRSSVFLQVSSRCRTGWDSVYHGKCSMKCL
jgi:hypothetical protein